VDFDLGAVRARMREAVSAALGITLRPLGPGYVGPRRMVLEALLGSVVDQEMLAERLTGPHSRDAVRALAGMPVGRSLAALAAALVRRTAPLLSQAVSAEAYNQVAPLRLEPGTWALRRGALDAIQTFASGGHAPPVLVAAALTMRMEELDGAALPAADAAARGVLQAMADGIATPLDPARVNTRLTWGDNLLFAASDALGHRHQARLDRAVLDHLLLSPSDAAVLEAGLATPVGRLGGKLSGGQQQLVALGRALLTPAPFLILDEPSSAFHPQLRAAVIGVLRQEAQSRSVVVVTHDMALARGCDRVIFVRDGAIAGEGTWQSLVAEDASFREWSETSGGAA
jgi:ABC-type branched-subunit amino acid transport system ATPase component